MSHFSVTSDLPCSSMEYSLPHAVMAFLQEEHSTNLPKSYFVSSSTRTTKITLIYTRRKSNSLKPSKKKSMTNGSVMNSEGKKHRSSYSSSSTDDYTQKSHSVQPCKYDSCDHSKLNRRMCASTPGRGYSGGMRTREMHRSQAARKMATDPVLRNSPNKDSLSLRDFTANAEGHEDFDGDDNFGILSPNSLFGDRPPTPGRDLNSSISPRPPTPNASNYASLMSSSKCDPTHLHTRAYPAQSKHTLAEHSSSNLSHRTQASRRSNNENGTHHRRGVREEAARQSDSCRISQHRLQGENALFTLPPIAVHSPSPDAQIIAGSAHFSRNPVKR